MLTSCAKNVTGWCGFSQRMRCMGKALSSIISLIGVFPIKREFGLVGVFILLEWCGYKGRWSDCSIFSLIGSLWQTQNIGDMWTEQSRTCRWAHRSIAIVIKFMTWRHTRMADTHICNLCPLGERWHGIWANRRLEDQACPVYVQSKITFIVKF